MDDTGYTFKGEVVVIHRELGINKDSTIRGKNVFELKSISDVSSLNFPTPEIIPTHYCNLK